MRISVAHLRKVKKLQKEEKSHLAHCLQYIGLSQVSLHKGWVHGDRGVTILGESLAVLLFLMTNLDGEIKSI